MCTCSVINNQCTCVPVRNHVIGWNYVILLVVSINATSADPDERYFQGVFVQAQEESNTYTSYGTFVVPATQTSLRTYSCHGDNVSN